jgi:hypothetical protein
LAKENRLETADTHTKDQAIMKYPHIRRSRFSTPVAVFLLTLSVCAPRATVAQNSEILSTKPPVYKIFNPDKNETTVSAMLIDPGLFTSPANNDRPVPDVRLNSAEYTYHGTIPSRPSAVAFVFMPLEKYKTPPNFSVTLDGTLAHEGETTLRELCCVQVNGRTQNPQHILVSIPLETFEKITQAKKTEIKLVSNRGKHSFKLNDFQRKSLTALAGTIQ